MEKSCFTYALVVQVMGDKQSCITAHLNCAMGLLHMVLEQYVFTYYMIF